MSGGNLLSSKLALLLLLVTGAGLHAIAGGGWVYSKGEGYFKLSQQWTIFNQYYDLDGTIVSDRTRSIGVTALYGEYGIIDRFDVLAYIPFFTKATIFEQRNAGTGATIREGEKLTSFGDAILTFKYGLWSDTPVVASLSLTLGLPFGKVARGMDGSLQTGDGEFNQMIQLDVGGSYNLMGLDFYGTGYFGFNNRTKGFSDDLRYGLELGWTGRYLSILMKMHGVRSLFNGSLGSDLLFSGQLVNNTEYVILSPEIILGNNVWGVTFTLAKAVTGKLMFVQPSYTLGIYYLLK